MALALNLRGDLAKLSDAELAERLSAAWQRHDANRQYADDSPVFSLRGPMRHPRIYRFLMWLRATEGNFHLLALPLVLSSSLTDRMCGHFALGEPHLALCEIRDIMDEMKKRVAARKANAQ
jgi:hypothetical protein